MQINPINNNQTNFKGQLFFKDAREYTRLGKEVRDALYVASEKIESIKSNNAKPENFYSRFANDLKEKMMKEDAEYKTIIKMESGDTYEVKIAPKVVAEAKKYADGTANIYEPEVFL